MAGRLKVSPLHIAWLAVAALIVGAAAGGLSTRTNDFSGFYESARAWREGRPLYAGTASAPNLNPPLFAVLLSPLTLVPVAGAYAIWTGVGALSVVASIRRISARTPLTPESRFWMTTMLIGWAPAAIVWQEGQVIWLLLYSVSRAWVAPTPVRAGLWLAPVVILKPPLALMAALTPWPIPLVAGIAAALGTLATVPLTGWEAWRDWLDQSRAVSWIGDWSNVSLWGLAARAHGGDVQGTSLYDISVVSVAAIVVVGAILAGVVLRREGGVRWTLALLWSLLLSPAGWSYYLPLALGPALASWRDCWLTRVALMILAIPVFVLGVVPSYVGGTILFGSMHFAAVALLWAAWTRRPRK